MIRHINITLCILLIIKSTELRKQLGHMVIRVTCNRVFCNQHVHLQICGFTVLVNVSSCKIFLFGLSVTKRENNL